MEKLFSVLASVLPMILFIALVVYFVVIKRMSTPKIYKTHTPLKLVGVSIMSCDADIERDDALLWEEFKKIRIKDGLEKPLSTIVVRLHTKKGEMLYEYFIGVTGEPNDVPEGFKYLEIPPQTYVMSKHKFKKGSSWLKSATKIKFHVYKKWLPDSEYELNRDQAVKAIEIHTVTKNSRNRYTQIFVAVKKIDHKRD